MANIYNVTNWSANKTYKAHDIVKYGDLYYYAKSTHYSGDSFSQAYWDGTGTWNNQTKPSFFWKPSYSSSIPITPKVKKVVFGDGYTQRNPDGINNVLLKLELRFSLRTNEEASNILHFLQMRAGAESFIFTPPDPYSIPKLFTCEDWNTTINYVNNYDITAVFDESVV